MKIIPWSEIVIIKDAPEEKTAQGVIIGNPGNYDDKRRPEKGIVIAVGKMEDDKKKLPVEIKEGDLIFYERYTSNRISHEGISYNFVRFKNIMGVIKE